MNSLLLLAVTIAVASCVGVPSEKNALGCQMCELVVKNYENSVDKDVTSIKNSFDKECKTIFHSIPFAPYECEKYVNNKLDPIIKELESGTAPKDVCTKLHECP